MICSKGSANFVIGNNRQIDEETKYPGAEEVPEAYRSKEHHSPVVWEWRRRLRLLRRPQLQEAPCFDREEGERDDLSCREERAERHMQRRFPGEVHVVHGADNTAS